MTNPSPSSSQLLEDLIAPFFASVAEFAAMTPVMATEMPRPYQALLAHQDHMTVTVEAFHDSLVNVEVLAVRRDADRYTRKILLTRQSDGKAVQFGIVHIDLGRVSPEVRGQILNHAMPLGRILIRNYELRQVKLEQLYRVEPGEMLRHYLDMPAASRTFGRTARIVVDHQDAVELLEIVAPLGE